MFSSSVIFICSSIISDVIELCVCSFTVCSSSILLLRVSVSTSSLCFSCCSFSWDSSRVDCKVSIWPNVQENTLSKLKETMFSINAANHHVYFTEKPEKMLPSCWAHWVLFCGSYPDAVFVPQAAVFAGSSQSRGRTAVSQASESLTLLAFEVSTFLARGPLSNKTDVYVWSRSE